MNSPAPPPPQQPQQDPALSPEDRKTMVLPYAAAIVISFLVIICIFLLLLYLRAIKKKPRSEGELLSRRELQGYYATDVCMEMRARKNWSGKNHVDDKGGYSRGKEQADVCCVCRKSMMKSIGDGADIKGVAVWRKLPCGHVAHGFESTDHDDDGESYERTRSCYARWLHMEDAPSCPLCAEARRSVEIGRAADKAAGLRNPGTPRPK